MAKMELKEGIVVKAHGKQFVVHADGIDYNCQLRGRIKFKVKGTTPVAVGDDVEISINEDNSGAIESVKIRRSVLSRPAVGREDMEHVIAANIDVLLIDDIQFIAGKESTQEEFFHTLNTLHGPNKQIVMTSDRPPKAMVTLEERLRSRFEWGLAADIQPPDFETRVAILQSKAERMGYSLPDTILEDIAHRFQTNIRELEGAMTRIMAYADLRGMVLDEDLVEYALADLMPASKEIEPEQILKTIAQEYGVSLEELVSHSRSQRIAFPRQIAMYMLREESDLSLPKIGEILGGRDHTTVMYGHEKITDLLETDKNLRRKLVNIQEILYSPVEMSV